MRYIWIKQVINIKWQIYNGPIGEDYKMDIKIILN